MAEPAIPLLQAVYDAVGPADLRDYPQKWLIADCIARGLVRRFGSPGHYVLTPRGGQMIRPPEPVIEEKAPKPAAKKSGRLPGPPAARDRKRDFVFELLVNAAIAGERCPQADGIAYALEKARLPGTGATTVPWLVARGKIKIEVFAYNYRVVTIATGTHAGKSTAEPPGGRGSGPYLVIEPGGRRHYPKRPVPYV